MAEFNLIDEPWIPCIDLHDHAKECGIRDALLNAHDLREICDDSPLVTVAIHRLLLAILYRAYEGPSNMAAWRSLYERGRFTLGDESDKYLNHFRPRFYLFDDTHPFMQIAGLDLNEYKQDGTIKKGKSDGLMRLVREAPDKGGRILFDHRVGTERPEYEAKQIARMMLSAQSYSGTGVASGGKVGKQQIKPTPCQFAPCVEGLVLWIQGESLFQTLLLNLVPRKLDVNDRPAWEDDSILDAAIKSWAKPTTFAGPVQRFATLNRLIRVVNRKAMFFTNGLKTEPDSYDPMKAYSRPDENQQYHPLKLRTDRAAWRDAHTLFSLGSPVRKPPASLNHLARLVLEGTIPRSAQPRANAVGLATDQGKALLWRHDRMPVPLGILGSEDLTERLRTLTDEAEAADKNLCSGLFWSATSKKTIRTEPVGRVQAITDLLLDTSLQLRSQGILRMSDGRFPQEAHNKAALDLSSNLDPRPAYWVRMEEHFFELLKNLPQDADAASTTWRNHVKREAKRALEESVRSLGTTARALQAVARVGTNFSDKDLKPRPPQAAETKPKRKGGKKK